MKGFSAEQEVGCVSPKSDLWAVRTIDVIVLAAKQKPRECSILCFDLGLILGICVSEPAWDLQCRPGHEVGPTGDGAGGWQDSDSDRSI